MNFNQDSGSYVRISEPGNSVPENDLQCYVDSILPNRFQPHFEDDLDARRSLDFDLGAASLWPEDSLADFDSEETRQLQFRMPASGLPPAYVDYSSLFDVVENESDRGLELTGGPLLLDSSSSPLYSSSDQHSPAIIDDSATRKKGYHHRERRKYLKDEELKAKRTRELNNKASVVYRKNKKESASMKYGHLHHLEQENEQLNKRFQLLSTQSDWCHDVYEKYSEHFAGQLSDSLQELPSAEIDNRYIPEASRTFNKLSVS